LFRTRAFRVELHENHQKNNARKEEHGVPDNSKDGVMARVFSWWGSMHKVY